MTDLSGKRVVLRSRPVTGHGRARLVADGRYRVDFDPDRNGEASYGYYPAGDLMEEPRKAESV
jgi:hypothetical protein